MSTVAAVAAVVGTVASMQASSKQARLQKEAGAVSTAAQKAEDAAQLRRQAREARVQRARISQQAETSGGGSREAGAISSLSTQLGAQQGRIAGQQATAESLSGINNQIAQAGVTKAVGQALQSVGSYSFEKSGGFDNLFKDG